MDKKVYDGPIPNQNIPNKSPINNNFFKDDASIETDRVKPDAFKKQPKNIFAVQNEGEEGKQFLPMQVQVVQPLV